ncbi:MAG: KpsF/GutQ family sugar-phosphate isomerase [Terriglobia bacterium]
MGASTCLAAARRVLEIEAETISRLVDRLDERFEQAADLILACHGRVVVTGMGKSGLIGQKISATLSSTGTPSYFLHPAEALHGDLGRLVKNDVLLALSTSGETAELLRLLDAVERLAVPLITLTGAPASRLALASKVVIDAGVPQEACPLGLAPTASTTAMLALGDALAMALLEKRGFSAEEYADLHPAGGLGMRLRRVESIMHTGDGIPLVKSQTALLEVIYEISRKGMGHAVVVAEDGRLTGFISDGDLRRFFQREGNRALTLCAVDCMTPSPVAIGRKELATEALTLMESRKITALPVVDVQGKLEGVLHIHDILSN